MHLEPGRKLLEMERLGPGTHEILRDDFEYETFTIAEGEWVYVGCSRATQNPAGFAPATPSSTIAWNRRARHRSLLADCRSGTGPRSGVRGGSCHQDGQGGDDGGDCHDAASSEPSVTGQPRAERLAVYEESRNICIGGVLAGL